MLSRRRFAFGLMGASACVLGVVGCSSDQRDATDLPEGGIGPAGKPSTEPQLDPNEQFKQQQEKDAEAAKTRK